MAISKGMFISQADMGLQAVNVLEKYKKHLAEEGASEEKQVAVIKAIKYCQECAEASHTIMAALDWQATQNCEPAEETAEDTPEEAPEEKPKKAPKCKRAPRKEAEPKTEEKPKKEQAPTLFDAPLEKPAETPKAEEVKEPPKEELKPQETKAEEPANDNSLDDLF